MTLDNLLAIHKLQRFEANAVGVQRLLAAAERNLADASIAPLSSENRFDAAYKVIMQCAMIGLWANGYRTSTSQPGHHQTALQVLPKTLGLDRDVVIVLDALRKQRNLNDYEGDPVSDSAVAECCKQAALLGGRISEFRFHKLAVGQLVQPVESGSGAVAVGSVCLFPPLSSGGAQVTLP